MTEIAPALQENLTLPLNRASEMGPYYCLQNIYILFIMC